MSQKNPFSMDSNIHLQLMFEHPKHKSMSFYNVFLDSSTPLSQLKEDLQERLNTRPQNQVWFYKGVVIPEEATLQNKGVKEHDTLLVKVDQHI